jgi:hypothetical protein
VPETAPTRACRENTTRSLKLERRLQEESSALILKVAPYTSARLDSPAAVTVMSRRKELPPTLKELKPNLSRTNSLVEAYSKAFVLACCLRCSTDLARCVRCDDAPSMQSSLINGESHKKKKMVNIDYS